MKLNINFTIETDEVTALSPVTEYDGGCQASCVGVACTGSCCSNTGPGPGDEFSVYSTTNEK
ncbi:hypothetical protein PRVXT_002248 [Proteinivorax tanatarense]|uniref:Uncharacterized protein n=1 Tax=Proteinivorax tanatarense TaxID=1260629 RepID=A0AAU7VJU6_9FIRM